MKRVCFALVSAAALFAQKPQIENAKLETRTLTGTLENQLTQFGGGPFWAGYSEPAMPRRQGSMCNLNEIPNAPIRLEGQTEVVILVRMSGGHVDELRTASPDCRIDAGGLPFYWFENISPAASVAWLRSNPTDSSLRAISLHAGSDAEHVLEELASDKSPRVRSKALFWLAQKAAGLQTISKSVATDPELSVKEQAVFALKQLPNNEGIPALIDVAKNHADPAVRKRAMFWLGQSNDSRAVDFFAQILKQ